MMTAGLGLAGEVTAQVTPKPAATAAAIDCPEIRGGLPRLPLGYSVSGKRGKYLCQAREKIEKTGIDAPGTKRELDALNRIEFQDRLLLMPETQKKLQGMLDRIATAWPYAGIGPIKVMVVGSGLYNAEALPDRSVKIHLGLLYQAETDEEVAFVLAHEYAHLALRHLNRNSVTDDQNRLLNTMTEVYANSVRLSNSDLVKTGSNLTLSSKNLKSITEAQRKAERANQQMHLALDVLSTPAWKRSQEDQADVLGYDLLRRAVIKPEGSYMVFSRLEAMEEKQKTVMDRLSKDMEDSVTDAATAKMEVLKAQAQTSGGLNQQNVQTSLNDMWKDINRKARTRSFETFKKTFNRSHRSVEDREEGLRDYVKIAYAEDKPVMIKSSSTWLTGLKATREFGDAERVVGAVEGSAAARRDGKYAEAQKALDDTRGSLFSNTAMVNNERARLYADMGQVQKAHETYLIAHTSRQQSVYAYGEHLNLLMDNRLWPQAKTVALAAIKRYEDDKPFYPPLVKISFTDLNEPAAVKYLNQCIEDSVMKVECADVTPEPASPEFKRLKPATQTAILRARGKVSDNNYINNASEQLNGFFDRLKKAADGKDND